MESTERLAVVGVAGAAVFHAFHLCRRYWVMKSILGGLPQICTYRGQSLQETNPKAVYLLPPIIKRVSRHQRLSLASFAKMLKTNTK